MLRHSAVLPLSFRESELCLATDIAVQLAAWQVKATEPLMVAAVFSVRSASGRWLLNPTNTPHVAPCAIKDMILQV